MKTKILLAFCLFSQIALSQTISKSSIDNGGASVSNANIQMVYTIGEVNVQEATVGDISLSEGFIGPDILFDGIYIPDPNFEQALIDLGIDSDGTINKQILRSDAEGVVSLNVADPVKNQNLPNVKGQIADLTGIEAFTDLTLLNCGTNLLDDIDVSQNLLLTHFMCDSNRLTVLNVSNNTALTLLWCQKNDISELVVRHNTALAYLMCHRNQLTDINVDNNPALYSLSCGNNLIPVIVVSLNPALQYLAVNDLPLIKGLDFSFNLLLKTLYCDNSGLTQLNLAHNTVLWDLICNNNMLTELDLRANTILAGLECSHNPIGILDLRNGNNSNMSVEVLDTKLSCIDVDDELADHSSWNVDPGVILSNDCGYNTQRGETVTVLMEQAIPSGEVKVKTTYDIVKLSGNTDLYVGDAGPTLPDGFVGDDPLSYLNIETTAEYEGYIEIAFDYSWMTFDNEEALRLMHYENEVWVDVTTWVDIDNDIIYGEVTTLSPFIILQDVQPPIFAGCTDITENNDSESTGAFVSFTTPKATDNSSEVTTEQTDGTGLTDGSFYPLGTTTLSYQATDGAGNIANCSFNVTVINPAPIIDEIIAPIAPIPLGENSVVKVFFTDNNLDQATINWGEGDESEGDIIGDINTNPIVWEYIYPNPGVYPVTIRLEDIGEESVEEIYRYIVIYDPSEGFVTGGGWIYSPPEAYSPDPLLEGIANFGFVSKYKKGSTVPVGNTEFQFKTGNLNFKSTEYEWLVIAGAKAMFKGGGTINGFGNYGFMVSAIDANLMPNAEIDKFRIKIWEIDNDDIVVYDNNFEMEENADPITKIEDGSIVIHKSKTKSAPIESNISTLIKESNLLVYPNPFNERLQFEFVSPENVNASIDIFDVTGRKVKTVFNGPVESNVNYRAEFVPVSEVSNFYFYQMKLGEEVFYGKVVYNKR